MKRTKSPFYVRRTFILSLLSFVAVATLVSFGVSARRASREAALRAVINRDTSARLASVPKPVTLHANAQDKNPNAPDASSITATLTDNIPATTKVAPGGPINYTAVITNGAPAVAGNDAGSVVYSATLHANTTLSGTVQVSPVAIDDTFAPTIIGNVSFNSDGILSVLTNDYLGQNPAGTITASDTTSLQGGNVVVDADGTFSYNPPAGYEGADSFNYTLSNAAAGSVGKVNLTVGGMVWFINNNAGACVSSCDGRLSHPFTTLAAFQAVNNGTGNNPAINDNIFVYESATAYTGGVTLLGGQKFIGQDSTDNLATISGLTTPTGSPTFPAMNTAGNATTLSGAGITLNGIGTTNVIRGMTITNTVANTKISGTGFGTLTVGKSGSPDVTLSGTGRALNLTTGTFAATSAFTSVAATSSTTQGINLVSVGGTVAFGSTTIGGTTNQGILVNTSGVNINFGNTTVATSAGTGVNLTTNTGTFTFADLDIDPNTNVRALHATNNSGTITNTSGTIVDTGTATALEIVGTSAANRTPTNMQWTTIAKNGGSTSAIILTNTSGTGFTINGTGVTVGSGGTLENIVGADAIALNTIGGLVTLKNMIIEDITAAGDTTAANGTRSNVDAISGLTVEGGLTLDNTTIRRISDNAILGGTNGIPDVATVWTGLTINNCTIEDTNRFNVASHGDATSEGTVRILGIRGTVNVTNSLFQRGAEFLDFTVTAGTLTMTVTNSDFLFAYKEFVAGDLSPQASVGLHGIDVTVQGTSNAAVTIGDRANAALACDFLNNRLASVRVANDVGATGNVDVTMGRNTFRSNDHSSGVACTPGCSTADFDFPMAGVLVMSRGADTATFDAIIDRNTFDEATNASGGVGQLTLDMSRGVWQVLAINNTFDTPGNAPWFMRAELNATTAKVKFQNNTGVGGFFTCSDASCGGGYNAPGLRALADVQNGGKLDLTIDNDTFAEHDTGFDPGQTFEGRALNVGAANALCMDLRNNNAPDGYGLEQFNASQTVNIFTAGGSGVCTAPGSPGNCQNALNANLNQGGTNNPNTVPPFVQVFGTVNVVGVACQAPSLALFRGEQEPREYLAQLDNASPRSTRGARTIEQSSDFSNDSMNATANQAMATAVAQIDPASTTTAPTVAQASSTAVNKNQPSDSNGARRSHHVQFNRSRSMKASKADDEPVTPDSGDPIGPINIGTLPAGESVTIKYAATVDSPPVVRQVSHQGTVTFTNPNGSVTTTDPGPDVVVNGPTVTLIDTTVTWDGSDSTDWHTAANWTPAFVPNSASDVIIPDGVLNFEPTINADVTVFSLDHRTDRTLTINTPRVLTVATGLTNLKGALAGGPYTLNFAALTINRAAGITLNGPTAVSGLLTLTSGNVTTGTNVLTLGSAAGNISRTTGHIVGILKKTAVTSGFIFTVGTTVGYTPLDITSASGSGDLTVETVGAAQPTLETNNPGKSLTEYWKLTEGGTLTASMVFHYLQTDVPVTSTEANYRGIRVVGAATASFPQNCPSVSCVNTTTDTFTISGVSNFSDWTVGEVLAPTASGGTVAGRIVDDGGAPVEGAVVRLSGAQNRKFITDANGVYRFENVETGGFYNVTPSRVNYTFSPAVISFSQLGETTEAAFGATATGGSVNPLDTPEYFVRQNYLDFLGREPDEAGFNFWSDQILGCGDDADCVDRKRTNVSAAYFLSIEFQETGGLVDGLYRASFGRRPSYGEFRPDAAAVAPALVVGRAGWEEALENGKAAFVDAFVQRAAFQTAYGGLANDAYVDALIANTGVSFTGAERNALVGGLAGGMTRAAVLRAIVEDADVVAAKRNSAFVMMEYFGYLRREPDAGGYLFWLDKLNQFNGNFEQAEMVRAFIVSQEYRNRFPR